MQLLFGTQAANLAFLIGNANLVSVGIRRSVVLPAHLVVRFQCGFVTSGPETLQPMLIVVLICGIYLTLHGIGIVEIMDMVEIIILEFAMDARLLIPSLARFAVIDETGLLAVAVSYQLFSFTAVTYAKHVVPPGFIASDVVARSGLEDSSDQSTLGSYVFIVNVLSFQVSNVGSHPVAVGIGDDTLVGVILTAGIHGYAYGESVGFTAANHAVIIGGAVRQLLPIRSTITIIPLIF